MTVDDIAPPGAGMNNRVLLVADEGCVARLLGDGLGSAGCVVTRAGTRDEDLFSKAMDHDTTVALPASVAFGDVEDLVQAVRQCLVDERQGRTIELPATVRDIPSALRRAPSADERGVICRLASDLRDESLTPPRRAA